ncbi:MAG: hypothetical protein P4N24_00150 [Acidobacteriota bacterium]|nr:hypothetical protein [Acidobacteriota bacterium]
MQRAENILAIAQSAKSPARAANDTQTAASKPAHGLGTSEGVAKFKYDDSTRGSAVAEAANQIWDVLLAG